MEEKKFSERSIWKDAQAMLEKADKEGVQTVWDRRELQNPGCTFCQGGTSCHICSMGPCRVIEGKVGKWQYGVCGADVHTIVARNFGRFVAAGSASHSDHGRDLVETLSEVLSGQAPGYSIRDEGKLRALAAELEIEGAQDRPLYDVAADLVDEFYDNFSSRRKEVSFVKRVPEQRRAIWKKYGMTPRGIDREITEMMHRTHMGVDNDYASLLLHAARTCLGDGWGGSMIGTEISDVLFGTPEPRMSKVNLGVLKEDHVNVLVHGHNPVVSEMVLAASRDEDLLKEAVSAGAKGINVVGLCCTGNELLMRQGIPLAGNHLMTELVIVTGAADAVVVDYQCIMPSLARIAQCYHTAFFTTSSKGRFPEATHVPVEPGNAREQCRLIVRSAVQAYTKRDPRRVLIPDKPVEMMSGFSVEAITKALGGSLQPLLDAIVSGHIKGIVGVVGCNNPKIKHDSANVALLEALIRRDILVVVTGCVTSAAAKAGLLVPAAAREKAGADLAAVCESLGVPPVLHMGSCVDNSRIIHFAALAAKALGVDISDLPVCASSPEWYSEKAAAIGLYAVTSGIPTHLGHPPMILGSSKVTQLAVSGLQDLVGAHFLVEGDMEKAADQLEGIILERREKLGI
ncbi:MAG TPA: anaerobic carbon-monoxide dehydrogenase catalytic subunit [Bacillota bacterium]|nr:anaerobic carbon-monoxide dehydrogenase catalytic subunit [Bacillota bacterium]